MKEEMNERKTEGRGEMRKMEEDRYVHKYLTDRLSRINFVEKSKYKSTISNYLRVSSSIRVIYGYL